MTRHAEDRVMYAQNREDRASVFAALRAWLIHANADVEPARLDPDTDIIESRILDSLQIVEFILFLEEKSGRAVLEEDLDPRTLRTLASIYENYFVGRP